MQWRKQHRKYVIKFLIYRSIAIYYRHVGLNFDLFHCVENCIFIHSVNKEIDRPLATGLNEI